MSWDEDFLDLASYWANKRSKDPSTKVGCVIARPDKTIASIGFNGLPRGVSDTTERLFDRALKYPMTVHAEANAIVTAREPLHGYTLYCTHPCCSNCTGLLIQAGISRVLTPPYSAESLVRWGEDLLVSKLMCSDAKVSLEEWKDTSARTGPCS